MSSVPLQLTLNVAAIALAFFDGLFGGAATVGGEGTTYVDFLIKRFETG